MKRILHTTGIAAALLLLPSSVDAKERSLDWDTNEDRWLREVVLRLEGPEGLAAVARAS